MCTRTPTTQDCDGTIFVLCVIGSFLVNGASPLFYELTVELTYPMPEAVSVGVLATMNNLGCLLLQLIAYFGYLESDPGVLLVLFSFLLSSALHLCHSSFLHVRVWR